MVVTIDNTRVVIFNKVTGEMEYKEIRTEPSNSSTNITDVQHIRISNWNGSNYKSSYEKFD